LGQQAKCICIHQVQRKLLAAFRALRPLFIALALLAVLIASLEFRLEQLGYEPTIVDSPDRWSKERMRASSLGDRALIVIGASRIQLGLDMATMRRETGLEPVQLAVLGSSPVAVLAGLAADPTITGTIIVDYYGGFSMNDTAVRYQKAYLERLRTNPLLTTGKDIETRLTRLLHDNLRSYADGETPFSSFERAISGTPRRLYLTTLPDRSRRADYSRVAMPAYYHASVMRSLGISLDTRTPGLVQLLRQKVDSVEPLDDRQFLKEAVSVRDMVVTIRQRGGRVFFVKMPTGGMVEEIETRQFPREKFWVPFLALTGAPGIWTADFPEMAAFKTPDGAHLDFRDQRAFTRHLMRALELSKNGI
jgi:hypothetical protein